MSRVTELVRHGQRRRRYRRHAGIYCVQVQVDKSDIEALIRHKCLTPQIEDGNRKLTRAEIGEGIETLLGKVGYSYQ